MPYTYISHSTFLSVVQAHTDLAIVTQFAIMLRSGFIGGINFTKVIGVGHSYGAIQLQALSATAPELLDAVLLQGFSMNSYVNALPKTSHLLTDAQYWRGHIYRWCRIRISDDGRTKSVLFERFD